MGTYGHPDVQTPYIDAISRQSCVFDRAYTASPLCTPARASIWTGCHPHEVKVERNHQKLSPDRQTIAHVLNENGYSTHYLGKWHLDGGGDRGVPEKAQGGFQNFCGWEAFHVDHWKGRIWEDDMEAPDILLGHETDGLTQIAIERLKKLSKQTNPFFLTINYQAPHAPCAPPEPFRDRYRGRDLNIRPNVDTSAYMSPQYGGEKRPEWDCDWREFVERYYGEISHLDAAIGRLYDTLPSLGLSDDTCFIIHSDHGENAGAFGRFEKHTMNEESIRVPLIIHHPTHTSAIRRDDLFSSIDIAPTILDLCGVEGLSSASGVSHKDAIFDCGEPARESMLVRLATAALLQEHLKLETTEDGKQIVALRDLQVDPFELQNFKDSPDYAQVTERMHHTLKSTLGVN